MQDFNFMMQARSNVTAPESPQTCSVFHTKQVLLNVMHTFLCWLQKWGVRVHGTTRIDPAKAVQFVMEVVAAKGPVPEPTMLSWVSALRNLQLFQQAIYFTDMTVFGHPDSIRSAAIMRMLLSNIKKEEVDRKERWV